MPIQSIAEFIRRMTGQNILLSAGPGESTDLTKELSVHFMQLAPGEEVRPHTHTRVETYVFLTGRAKVMTGDEIRECTTGDVAIAPSGVPHGIKVIGADPVRLYAVNAPAASTSPMRQAPEEILWKWRVT